LSPIIGSCDQFKIQNEKGKMAERRAEARRIDFFILHFSL